MKTLFNIWTSLCIATLLIAVLYLCSSCTEANANTSEDIEYYLEDNYCVAPATGIIFQDIQFVNDVPYYNCKPVVFTAEACNIMARLLYKDLQDYPYPFAAVAFDCNEYYVVDVD